MKVSLPAGDILDFPNMFRTFVPFPVSKNDYTGAELYRGFFCWCEIALHFLTESHVGLVFVAPFDG